MTNTKSINETHPFEITHHKYSYLAESNGGINRFQAVFDSTISSIDTIITYRYYSKSATLTDFKRNIVEMDFSPVSKKMSYLILDEGKYKFYLGEEKADVEK